MVVREYYFQVIDELEENIEVSIEPPYSVFYVERSDVGNIPIYNFTPGGGMWWFLDEQNIRGNQSRTEEPTSHFEELGRQIAEFPPAISNHLHPEEVAHEGELSIGDSDLEPLPQHEVDLVNEILHSLSEGKNLPKELQKYLKSIR
jgi:hypothetical protein